MAKTLQNIEEVAHFLKLGKIGIFPCDTIWGLIGIANEKAAQKIINLKKREQHKGFIHLIDSEEQLNTLIDAPLNTKQQSFCNIYWPGPVSCIFSKKASISQFQTGNPLSIAVRWPQFSILNTLQELVKEPLISSSVNISQQPNGLIENFDPEILASVDFIYHKIYPPKKTASTLVDLRTEPFQILRQGSVSINKV